MLLFQNQIQCEEFFFLSKLNVKIFFFQNVLLKGCANKSKCKAVQLRIYKYTTIYKNL